MNDRRQAPSMPGPLGDLLAGGRSIVLDGGLATQLEADGADIDGALWSARLLADDPDAIVRAHLAFYRAGAQVATTASYQATFDGFARRGLDRAATAALLRRSVELAREARSMALAERRPDDERGDEPGAEPGDDRGVGAPQDAGGERPLLVAASIGPYGASLADGSEYRGRYGLSAAALRDVHVARMATLLEADPDLLACETIPDLDEGVALVRLLDELDGRGWLSFTCSDGSHLRDGTPVEEAFGLAGDSDRLLAIGINCTAPEHVLELVERAAAVTSLPVLAYPNSGEAWDPIARRWRGPATGSVDATSALAWVAAGARLVGGCCRVTPARIGEIAASLGAVA